LRNSSPLAPLPRLPPRPPRPSSSSSTASRIRTTSARFSGRATPRAFPASYDRRAIPRRSTASSGRRRPARSPIRGFATVVNIARAIEELEDANVWTIGLAGDAADRYTDVDWTLPSAIVLGAEGTGLRRLVRERCDRLVRIPMQGQVGSLNVSVAAGVVLYEVVRQRNGR
jgi:hypothetical protein